MTLRMWMLTGYHMTWFCLPGTIIFTPGPVWSIFLWAMSD